MSRKTTKLALAAPGPGSGSLAYVDPPCQPRGASAGTGSVCCVAGLDSDGIYRVSGNLAVIQKLRFLVNHGEEGGLEGFSHLSESDIINSSLFFSVKTNVTWCLFLSYI